VSATQRFAGSVAIVTGGASGIGRALCEALARRGAAALVVVDTDAPGAARTVEAIARGGGCAEARALDVRDAPAVEAVVRETVAAHGRLDLHVNAAGIGIWGDVREFSLEQWRQVLDVDFWGVVHGTRAAYAVMAQQRSGTIVNVSSLAGLVSAPTVVPYAAAKHAVVGLSTSWGAEAQELGVQISVACPGPIRTGFHAAALLGRVGRAPRAPENGMDAAEAAQEILRGVSRGRRVIVFPAAARRIWALSRLWPSRVARRNRDTVRRLAAQELASSRDRGGA
jgi:NAD(P)-dependent dehydrogenase (short-subunit alcohol dehydrogenase family)